MTDPFTRLADLVTRTRSSAAVTIGVMLLLAAVATMFARGIRVDTNLEALLADNSPSVEALEELRSRQGSTDLLNIAVKSSDPVANRKLVEDMLARVSTWPEVTDAWIDLDYTVMRDHALYYIEPQELEELRDTLAREKQRAIASKLSLGGRGGEVDLDKVTDDDDNWDESPEDWAAEAENGAEAPPVAKDPEEPTTVRELLERQRERIAASGRVRASDLDLIWPQENERGELVWQERVTKSLASEDGQVMLLRARLTTPPTNLQFATKISNDVDAMLEELDVRSYAPDMLAKIGGAYSTSGEAKAITKDLNSATWLSATLVALVLVGGFRSPRGLAIVLLPLAVSVVVTVAVARAVLGELNVLTAFLFAVLLGIGVDFAVHLYAQRERQGARPDWGAVMRHHFRPLFSSMATTMGAFFILMVADFKGFKEFGLIAGLGVLIAFTSALVMVPAIDVLLGSLRRTVPPDLPPTERRPAYRAPKLRWALLLGVFAFGAFAAPRVAFERDMRELRSPKSEGEEGIAYQRALRSTEDTGTPVVLLADSREQLELAIAKLEAARETDKLPGHDASWIKNMVSLGTHMPAQQDDKAKVLAEIAELSETFLGELPDLAADAPARKYQTHLEALHRLASQSPLREDELPQWAKQLFEEKDGSIGKIGLLYVGVSSYALDDVTEVTRRFRSIVDGTGVRGASTRFILGDLTMDVEADTRTLPPLALLVILAIIVLDVRNVRGTLYTFGALLLGLWLTFAVMGVWPIRINFYNLVVMPAVVGLGIDASIHLWHSRNAGASRATSKAAILSALTTAGGFAGLLISDHGGLRSIGLLGVIATLGCVVMAVIALGWPRKV